MDSSLYEKYKYLEVTGLPNSFFKKNRERFFENVGKLFGEYNKNSVIVIQGGSEVARYDTDVEHNYFLQESNFYYLTGVREPDFYAVLDFQNQSLSLFSLILPQQYKIWMTVPSIEELSKVYETSVLEIEKLEEWLLRRNPDVIYTLEGVNSDSGIKYKTAEFNFSEKGKEILSKVNKNELLYEILADTRVIKTPEELEVLTYISEVTVDAHLEVMRNIKPGLLERHMEVEFNCNIRRRCLNRDFPYRNIGCCGIDSATLHYNKNDNQLQDGQLFLFDMGARVAGYVSDVTSTIPVNGKFSKRQKEIYDLVLKSNLAVQAALKPGVFWPDMHLLAERVILEGLIELGLLNKGFSIDELLDNRVGFYFMPHGLGHLIGLEVHDVGGYLSFTSKRSDKVGLKNIRFARVVEEGYALTVEPGIYFIQFHLESAFKDEKLSKYFNVDLIRTYFDFGGIRIEDDIIITKEGCKNLNARLPRTTEDIEKAMANK